MFKKKKRALVISGGGSKGAYAGGVAEYLIKDLQKDYDLYVGTSTGSLLCPLLSIGELDKLKNAYTSVKQNDIFNLNPFIIKKHNKIKMNFFKAAYSLIKGNRSFGEAENLKGLIREFLTKEDYDNIRNKEKEVIACVTNFTTGEVEYKSTDDYSREDFADWMYASSCVPPFMKILKKDGYEYVDGGVVEKSPIEKAIDEGASEIDVINLKKEGNNIETEKPRNVIEVIMRLIKVMMGEIGKNDTRIPRIRANKGDNINLNIYYTPRKLISNSLIFKKELMQKWWKEGYENAHEDNMETYQLKGRRKPELLYRGKNIQ